MPHALNVLLTNAAIWAVFSGDFSPAQRILCLMNTWCPYRIVFRALVFARERGRGQGVTNAAGCVS